MWSEDVREEIEEMFERLAGVFDWSELQRGSRVHGQLTLLRSTIVSREVQTFEQRKAKRAELERRRREYKTTKQREYRAKRAA